MIEIKSAEPAGAERCPNCDSDLRGDPIPERFQAHNVPGTRYYDPNGMTHDDQMTTWQRCFCRPWGDATHFSRKIGRTVPAEDMTVEWTCPDCGYRWPVR